MFFGIESGSRKMLSEIKKGIDYEKIEQTFIDCAEAGIVTRAGFIIGFPGETEEQLKETIALAQRLRTSQISFYYYSLVPKSEAYIKLLNEKKTSQPQSLMVFAGRQPFDKLVNFSSVSNTDLKVVYSWFLLRRFFTVEEAWDDELSSRREIASDFLIKSLKEFSFEKVFYSFWSVMKAMTIILFHPNIIKKYHLGHLISGD